MELRWKFEQGAWRVVGGDLIDVRSILDAEQRALAVVPPKGVATKTSKSGRGK
jgi:hypothetical protein